MHERAAPPPERPARQRRAVAALFLVTLIWGLTFVWMEEGLEAAEAQLGPGHRAAGLGTILVLRFGLAAVLLLACVPAARRLDRASWRGGLVLGGLLWAGFVLQMAGLYGVTPGVSAFLTSLYVIFTGLIQALVQRRALRLALVGGALLATAGAALIRGPAAYASDAHGVTGPWIGELLTVGSALVFAVHILATDRITRRVAALPVTVTSFAVVALASLPVVALDLGNPQPVGFAALCELAIAPAFLQPLLLSSVFASAVAISFMNLFQRDLEPFRAAILYALEPIWAACAAIFAGREELSAWLWIGGGLLLGGNLVAELGARARSASGRV